MTGTGPSFFDQLNEARAELAATKAALAAAEKALREQDGMEYFGQRFERAMDRAEAAESALAAERRRADEAHKAKALLEHAVERIAELEERLRKIEAESQKEKEIYSRGVDVRVELRKNAEIDRARIATLEAALEAYELAIDEAEAIFGGEYADHYGPMFELAMAARDKRRTALTGGNHGR